MLSPFALKPPFFEIGPKSYLYGDDVLELALAADRAAQAYNVHIIFTPPLSICAVLPQLPPIFMFLRRIWTLCSQDAGWPTFCRNRLYRQGPKG